VYFGVLRFFFEAISAILRFMHMGDREANKGDSLKGYTHCACRPTPRRLGASHHGAMHSPRSPNMPFHITAPPPAQSPVQPDTPHPAQPTSPDDSPAQPLPAHPADERNPNERPDPST
jgi:hypothetical protein